MGALRTVAAAFGWLATALNVPLMITGVAAFFGYNLTAMGVFGYASRIPFYGELVQMAAKANPAILTLATAYTATIVMIVVLRLSPADFRQRPGLSAYFWLYHLLRWAISITSMGIALVWSWSVGGWLAFPAFLLACVLLFAPFILLPDPSVDSAEVSPQLPSNPR